LLSGTE